MKKLYIIMLIAFLSLNAEALFEIKDASDQTVLEVSADGLRIFNQGDTLMVISSTEIKAFIDESAKDKALSRSFSVTTSAASGKGDSKMFEIGASDGAIFYNPTDNTDQILSINKNSITANVNPSLNRDFIVNDQAAAKGGGNLMKISNESAFVAVDDSTMLWYKQKNAFRVGHVLIASDSEVGQASFASGRQTKASGDYSTALGYNTYASFKSSTAMGQNTTASGFVSTAMGYNTLANGTYSTAMGTTTEASGDNAVAMGGATVASGGYSTSMGWYTNATGHGSVAMGMQSDATGFASLTMGYYANAKGKYSSAMGHYVTAKPYGSFVAGRYNVIAGDSASWIDTDPLFVLGNGSSSAAPSNAFEVKKNGNTTVNGIFMVKALEIADLGSSNLGLDGDIVPYISVTFDLGNNTATEHWDDVVANEFVTYVAKDTKNNAKSIDLGLDQIMKLRPITYKNDRKRLGLIPDEVEKVIPEAVVSEDIDINPETGERTVTVYESKGMNYIELIPVLIKSIQEQQVMINEKQEYIEKLESRLERIERLLDK